MKLPGGEGLRPAVLTPTRASSQPRRPRGRDRTSESAETLTHLVTYGQHQSLGLNGEKGRPNGPSVPYCNSSGRKGPPRTGLNPYTCRSGLSPTSEPPSPTAPPGPSRITERPTHATTQITAAACHSTASVTTQPMRRSRRPHICRRDRAARRKHL